MIQNQFHDEKNSTYISSYEEKNQFQGKDVSRMYKVHAEQQFLRIQKVIGTQQVPRTKSVSMRRKSQYYNFNLEKNQHATSSREHENQCKACSTRQKLKHRNFHEQNQFHKEINQCASFIKIKSIKMQEVSRVKIRKQEVLWTP